jgi:hypothetical protein
MIRPYHFFPTQQAAQNYINRVNNHLGYPKPGTTTYAVPEETIDGMWAVLLKRDIDAVVVPGAGARENIERRLRIKSEVDAPTEAAAAAAPLTARRVGGK